MTTNTTTSRLAATTQWGSTKATSFMKEFRQFALKGNVIDLAIGVIIGAAFAKIVDSLVKHIIMPFVGLLLPTEQSYLSWKWVVDGQEIPYGLFLGEVLNFLIVALALFIFVVKFLGWVARRRAAEEEIAAPAAPSAEVKLLGEIRDLLARRDAPR